jgi:hypothetical protein
MKTLRLIPLALLSAALLVAVTLGGCKKDESTASSTDFTTQAADFELGEQTGSDIDQMADDAYENGAANLRLSGPASGSQILSCAVVTNDTVNHVLTIDFGSGCTGPDGRTRSGQVIVGYLGHYLDSGFTRTITFNNFFVDSNQVTGTRSVTNNGFNPSGNLTWTIVAQNMRITRPGGAWHEWNSTRTREMTAGLATPHMPLDDQYRITGTAASSNSQGGSVTAVITSPLHKAVACHWVDSGTVEITPLNLPVRILDYGSGNCDRMATVTVNGNTRTIFLH